VAAAVRRGERPVVPGLLLILLLPLAASASAAASAAASAPAPAPAALPGGVASACSSSQARSDPRRRTTSNHSRTPPHERAAEVPAADIPGLIAAPSQSLASVAAAVPGRHRRQLGDCDGRCRRRRERLSGRAARRRKSRRRCLPQATGPDPGRRAHPQVVELPRGALVGRCCWCGSRVAFFVAKILGLLLTKSLLFL
jgi:hypothetical protein